MPMKKIVKVSLFNFFIILHTISLFSFSNVFNIGFGDRFKQTFPEGGSNPYVEAYKVIEQEFGKDFLYMEHWVTGNDSGTNSITVDWIRNICDDGHIPVFMLWMQEDSANAGGLVNEFTSRPWLRDLMDVRGGRTIYAVIQPEWNQGMTRAQDPAWGVAVANLANTIRSSLSPDTNVKIGLSCGDWGRYPEAYNLYKAMGYAAPYLDFLAWHEMRSSCRNDNYWMPPYQCDPYWNPIPEIIEGAMEYNWYLYKTYNRPTFFNYYAVGTLDNGGGSAQGGEVDFGLYWEQKSATVSDIFFKRRAEMQAMNNEGMAYFAYFYHYALGGAHGACQNTFGLESSNSGDLWHKNQVWQTWRNRTNELHYGGGISSLAIVTPERYTVNTGNIKVGWYRVGGNFSTKLTYNLYYSPDYVLQANGTQSGIWYLIQSNIPTLSSDAYKDYAEWTWNSVPDIHQNTHVRLKVVGSDGSETITYPITVQNGTTGCDPVTHRKASFEFEGTAEGWGQHDPGWNAQVDNPAIWIGYSNETASYLQGSLKVRSAFRKDLSHQLSCIDYAYFPGYLDLSTHTNKIFQMDVYVPPPTFGKDTLGPCYGMTKAKLWVKDSQQTPVGAQAIVLWPGWNTIRWDFTNPADYSTSPGMLTSNWKISYLYVEITSDMLLDDTAYYIDHVIIGDGKTCDPYEDEYPPTIQHTPVVTAMCNTYTAITAYIADNIGVTVARVNYREVGQTIYMPVNMTTTGNILPGGYREYIAYIPTGMNDIEYFIWATDEAGNDPPNGNGGSQWTPYTIDVGCFTPTFTITPTHTSTNTNTSWPTWTPTYTPTVTPVTAAGNLRVEIWNQQADPYWNISDIRVYNDGSYSTANVVIRYFFSIDAAHASSVQVDIPYDNSSPYAGGNPVTTTVQNAGGDCYYVDVIYAPPLIPLGPGAYYQFRLKLGTGGNAWMTPNDDWSLQGNILNGGFRPTNYVAVYQYGGLVYGIEPSCSFPTATFTITNTVTNTRTFTNTFTNTSTFMPTNTPPDTYTPTWTFSVTNTRTASNTPTPTFTCSYKPAVSVSAYLEQCDLYRTQIQIKVTNNDVMSLGPVKVRYYFYMDETESFTGWFFDTTYDYTSPYIGNPQNSGPVQVCGNYYYVETSYEVYPSATVIPGNSYHMKLHFGSMSGWKCSNDWSNQGLPINTWTGTNKIEVFLGSCQIYGQNPCDLPTNTPTQNLVATNTFTKTPGDTNTYTPTYNATDTFTSTLTFTLTETPTLTYTLTITQTITETLTATITATQFITDTETQTPTFTATETFTFTETVTGSQPPTWTNTNTPTDTNTFTFTTTHTITATATNSFTATFSETHTLTFTPTWTGTQSSTQTLTFTTTYTATATYTFTFTVTNTATQTATNTFSFTATNTHSITSTITFTFTQTNTSTYTFTRTQTQTFTVTRTPTHTSTPTPEGVDLKIILNAEGEEPKPGAKIKYTITIENNSNTVVSHLAVWDTLPDGIKFLENNSGISYQITKINGRDYILWDLSGYEPLPGQKFVMSFTVEMEEIITKDGLITNVIAADYNDPVYTPLTGKHPPVISNMSFYPKGKPVVYPNPFNLNGSKDGMIKFENLVPGSAIYVFTLAGENVINKYANETKVLWDCRNKYGNKISQGIYFYIIENRTTGKSEKGKIFIIAR